MAMTMGSKIACWACLVLCMARLSSGQGVFDVTQYGAKADGQTDNTQAFSDAWKAACEFNGSASLVIPQGTFLVGPLTFRGPCSNNRSPSFQISGTLKAPSSLASFIGDSWFVFWHLDDLVVGGGGVLDGQGTEAWSKRGSNSRLLPNSVRFCYVRNATITDLTFLDSKGFHMSIHRCSNVNVRSLNISAPDDSPNTDGIHISGSSNVDVASLTIGTGDDCISIGAGCTNISISNIACGPGHGISIGSLGKYKDEQKVAGVKVRNCTISGTPNGVRIKSWPGAPPNEASDITFEDIVTENVTNPIIIDQEYCPRGQCNNNQPSGVQIRDVTFRRIKGTSGKPVAVNLLCSPSVPCQNVTLEDIQLEYVSSANSSAIVSSPAPNVTTSSCFNVKGTALGIQNPPSCL